MDLSIAISVFISFISGISVQSKSCVFRDWVNNRNAIPVLPVVVVVVVVVVVSAPTATPRSPLFPFHHLLGSIMA